MRIKTIRQFENLKMKNILAYCSTAVLLIIVSISSFAQTKDLGEQQDVLVTGYKPVLAESFKISDAPDKDTSSSVPPVCEPTLGSAFKVSPEGFLGLRGAVVLRDSRVLPA